MIRYLLPLLLLSSCGGHSGGSHAAAPVQPPSTAFADIAGTYTGQVTFATGMPFDADPVGSTVTLTIAADGTVTSGWKVWHLTRNPDGTFKTDGCSIQAGLTEFGNAPANLATCHLWSLKLWAGFTDQGTLYGSEDLILSKNVGG